jgi:hypothetical protein
MAIVFIGFCNDWYHVWDFLKSGHCRHFGYCQNTGLSGNLALPVFRGEVGGRVD